MSRADLERIVAEECVRRGTKVAAKEVFVSAGLKPGSWLAGLRHPRDGSDVPRVSLIGQVGDDLATEYILKPD